MPLQKITSIREYAVYHAVVIFVVVFVAAFIHYLVYSHFINEFRQREHVQQLQHSVGSIARLLEFYQQIVDKMAQQYVVTDLLQFGDDDEIQKWSVDMQRLLPESIGVALFDDSGKILGRRSELRLSDQCFKDMQRHFSGLPVTQPPVHHEIEILAHFDIVSPVVSDGKNIGLVFASFSLDTIDRLLQDMAREGYAYQVVTPDDYLLASVGVIHNKRADYYEMIIPGTDWIMQNQIIDPRKNIFLVSLLVSNIVAFILVSTVLVIAIKMLFKLIVSDFKILTGMMNDIRNDTFDTERVPTPHLRETTGIVQFIQHAAEELNRHQKKLKKASNTDELTGLYNRRMLNEKLEHFLKRADEGGHIYLVIVDLDYLKQINDAYGHETGDAVLKMLSESLKNRSREQDLCSRAGGDEFVIVLDDYDMDDVNQWYEGVSLDFSQAVDNLARGKDISFQYGISAGCTMIRVSDNKSALLKRADQALYNVKSRGRNDIMCV